MQCDVLEGELVREYARFVARRADALGVVRRLPLEVGAWVLGAWGQVLVCGCSWG